MYLEKILLSIKSINKKIKTVLKKNQVFDKIWKTEIFLRKVLEGWSSIFKKNTLTQNNSNKNIIKYTLNREKEQVLLQFHSSFPY